VPAQDRGGSHGFPKGYQGAAGKHGEDCSSHSPEDGWSRPQLGDTLQQCLLSREWSRIELLRSYQWPDRKVETHIHKHPQRGLFLGIWKDFEATHCTQYGRSRLHVCHQRINAARCPVSGGEEQHALKSGILLFECGQMPNQLLKML
jgi:hypothetical protein